jgi:hypothetical protein
MSEYEFAQLVEQARKVAMSAADEEKQRRSFAYGNANIENSAVTREVIEQVADQLRHKG